MLASALLGSQMEDLQGTCREIPEPYMAPDECREPCGDCECVRERRTGLQTLKGTSGTNLQ